MPSLGEAGPEFKLRVIGKSLPLMVKQTAGRVELQGKVYNSVPVVEVAFLAPDRRQQRWWV